MTDNKIKVLIVEDSPSVQQLLKHILISDPNIEITDIASNGSEALEMIKTNRPDIITMDMDMPVMDGEETTRIIMELDPIPIIVITASFEARHVKNSYRAINAGALTVIEKPVGPGNKNFPRISKEILRNVKNLAHVKLVKRKGQKTNGEPYISAEGFIPSAKLYKIDHYRKHIAIGASTGGPPVIQYILKNIPRDFSASIYIVQHISSGFLEGFVDWLNSTTGQSIIICEHDMNPEPGKIYVAPDNSQTGLSANGRFDLQPKEGNSSICPSISHLFNSLARNYGKTSAGILLTGMGKDGAAELKMMRNSGAETIAQDKDSSIIFGMPGEAIKIGAAKFVLPPEKIVEYLKLIIGKESKSLSNQV